MVISTILFLIDTPFNKRDFERFGIKLLQENGFNIKIWDLTEILHHNLNYIPCDAINLSLCNTFNNKNCVLNKIKNLLPNTYIINFIGYSSKSYWLYKIISNSKAKYAVFMGNSIPKIINNNRKKISYIKKINNIRTKDLTNFIKRFFYKIPFSWIGIKPANLVLAGGEQCFQNLYPIDKSTKILWAHAFDYDIYLKNKNIPFSNQSIAVFIDEYVPFHPDYSRYGIQPPDNENNYYNKLNKFFDYVEKTLNIKVIIAAHPRSYYENKDYFKGRECVRNKTFELIKKSRLVLTHSSTSINFVALLYKPVIFITSYELDKSWLGPMIKTMSNYFKKDPIFMDDNKNINWKNQIKVNNIDYDNYRRKYIKTDNSEDILFWQMVSNRLKCM